MDLLLNYDNIYELAHSCDKQMYTSLRNKTDEYSNANKFSFFSLLFASKVKRKQTSLSEYKVIFSLFQIYLFFYFLEGLDDKSEAFAIFKVLVYNLFSLPLSKREN